MGQVEKRPTPYATILRKNLSSELSSVGVVSQDESVLSSTFKERLDIPSTSSSDVSPHRPKQPNKKQSLTHNIFFKFFLSTDKAGVIRTHTLMLASKSSAVNKDSDALQHFILIVSYTICDDNVSILINTMRTQMYVTVTMSLKINNSNLHYHQSCYLTGGVLLPRYVVLLFNIHDRV